MPPTFIIRPGSQGGIIISLATQVNRLLATNPYVPLGQRSGGGR